MGEKTLTGEHALKSQKIVMCGTHESGWETIKYFLCHGLRFSYFVLITPEQAIKEKVSGFKAFEDLAEAYNIPVYYAKKYSLKDPEDIAFFRENKFDLLVQGGWQRLFPEEVLETLSIGAIGGHGSSELLPKGRGRSPINWSLIEGKKRFVMHYFIIKPGVDDGDIFHLETCDITPWDDCRTMYYKISILTQKVLLKYIPLLLNGNYTTIPQKGEPSYYPKRTAEDGIIDWSKTIFEIYNFIRALTHPYPGAFGYINGVKIMLWKAQPFDTRILYPDKAVGEVVEVFYNGNFVVNCNSGLLLVTEASEKVNIGDIFSNA